MKRKTHNRAIHVRGDEETGALFEAAYYGPVSVPWHLAERMGAFHEPAHEGIDTESAYETERLLAEQEADDLSHSHTTGEGGTTD